MFVLSSIVIFVCVAISTSRACFSCISCPKTDLESDFCGASIVMHVRVLSGPRQEVTANDDILSQVSSYDPDDVYSVQIVNIFKGKENVTQLPGLQLVGVRSPIFVIDFHTPAQWWEFCIPSLKAMKRGHEYLLSGYIEKDKLRSSYCNMRHSWASVTHQQRRGLNGKYSENC